MKLSGLLLVAVLMLSACGPAPTPNATPDVPATVAAISGTMLAGTLTAQPSSTPLPTNTIQPTTTPTTAPVSSLTPTPSQTAVPAPTATPWSGAFAPGNVEGLPTGLLQILNNTGQPEIIVTLNGTTQTREQTVYYSYKVTNSLNLEIYWGRYQYIVQIPGKRILTGTFGQSSKDKTTMRVDLTKIVISGP